jgi:LPS sulfotransferase NodH
MTTSHKKMVILSTARSGTSVLKETLATHPDALMHGEIFHEKIEWHIHPEYVAQRDVTRRDRDPVGFVQEILETNLGRKVVGFKFWRSQSEPACRHILESPEILKIILERKNRLAAFSSSLLANKTQVWNIRGTEPLAKPVDAEKLPFQAQAFRNFLRAHDELFAFYRSEAKGTVIDLTYQQVSNLDIDELLKALDLEGFPYRHQMQRLYSTDTISRFEEPAHERIRAELVQLGHEDWLHEQ